MVREAVSVPPVDRRTFHRLLGRLDATEFERFVADLWEKRGWETTREDRAIVATRTAPPERVRLHVVDRDDPLLRATEADDDEIVVTRTRVGRDQPDGRRIVDGDDLYDRCLYGVDRDTLDPLFRRHFDRPAVSPATESPTAQELAAKAVGGLTTRGSVRMLGVLLLAVALVLAGTSAVPMGADPGPGDETTVSSTERPVSPTAVPVAVATDTPTPVPLDGVGSIVPGCPVPPTDAPPRDLRPSVIPHVSPTGLEGWEITTEASIEAFPGPNALPTPIVPERQHVASYRNPAGDDYRLMISRWQTVDDARDVVAGTPADGPMRLAWGRYTAAVEVFTDEGRSKNDTLAMVNARLLLSQLVHPDGGKLGAECVETLLDQRGTGSEATQTPYPHDLTDRRSTP